MNEPNEPPEKAEIAIESIAGQLMSVSGIHINVSQEVIITTEDKVRLCLSEHLKSLEKKSSWIAPLGILIAIVVTLSTSTFRQKLFSADTWFAIFVIAGLISLLWLIISVVRACRSRKLEDIIAELKKESRLKTVP